MKAIIYDNVHWAPENSELGAYVILGLPPRGTQPGESPLILGAGAVVRAHTVIYAGSEFGAGLQTGHHVMIREDNILGDEVSVGTSSTLEFGNRIGSRVRIHSGCFLERVTLEDDVFVGPNVVFTDDPHPMCPRYQECTRAAYIGAGTSIGANTTLLPGIKIGKNCLIGAGSVVTRDVPDGMVVAGNPARVVKAVRELSCPPGLYERPYIWREQQTEQQTEQRENA